MKLLFTTLALILLAGHSVQSQTTPTSDPTVSLDKVWIDYDVIEQELNGMRVHISFSATRLRKKSFTLRYTILDEDEEPLRDSDGNVIEFETDQIAPDGDMASVRDLSMFVPYGDFGLDEGNYRLIVDIDLIHPDGEVHIAAENFEFSKAGSGADEDESGISVQVKDLTINPNATREGRKGLLVTLTLDKVTGLKGVTSGLAMSVLDMDDDPVMANSEDYASESGHLATVLVIKPAFDPAKFENVELFIPYDEFVVAKGTRKLKLDFDIVSSSWETLKHLDLREFEMVKK